VSNGIALRQGLDNTGASTPPSFLYDRQLKFGAHAPRVCWQLAWGHVGRPDLLTLYQAQGPQKAQVGRLDAGLKRSLGHLQTHKVVRKQRPQTGLP